MAKRSAYIGLSGPLCYDYKNKLNTDYPNPILEAPVGLMVLYDEVVFLNEIVCPKSMRNLDFVKFISDKKDIKDFFERIDKQKVEEYKNQTWQGEEFPFKELGTIAKQIAPFAGYDNHSQYIKEIKSSPNSAAVTNVVYDNLVAHEEGLTLITNSLIDKTLVPRMNAVLKENLVNVILSKRIPNYLTEEGPYIETIYDIRSRDLIKEFRNKIDQVIGNRDNESINDLISKIENEFNEIRNEFTLRAFNKLRIYNSIGSVAKAVVPEVLKNVPGLGIGISAYDITKDLLEVWNDREYAWAGFLADLETHAVPTGKGS